MVLGIDFDGVMNDMVDTWVSTLNEVYGTSVNVSDIKHWEMNKAFPMLTEEELFAPLYLADFWDRVPAKYEASEVIAKLLTEGHRIYVVTTTHYDTLSPKLTKCLFKHFPYLSHHNVIITYNKSLINCDLLFDDAEFNLVDFPGIRVLFDTSYNKTATAFDYKVGSWKEFYILVAGLTAKTLTPPTRIHTFSAGRGHGKTAWLHQHIKDSDGFPCYVITTQEQYDSFCNDYLKRFGQRCPAKLLSTVEKAKAIHSTARLFVDMPSQFSVKSEVFEVFKTLFIARSHLIFVADFEDTFWHAIHALDRGER